MNFDIIGDIHRHSDALIAQLKLMGYRKRNGAWKHPERSAIFVGDFIDRGPNQIEIVDIVRRMVDAGNAMAVMGNHELNAIAWYLPDPYNPGEYLRTHHSEKYGDKNYRQHKAFLSEVNNTPKHKEIIDWFLTLPLWLELAEIRIVHACWHQRYIDCLIPILVEIALYYSLTTFAFPLIFILSFCLSLPLHVTWIIRTATAKWFDMVNDIAWTRTLISIGSWARMRIFKKSLCLLATMSFSVSIRNH